jgi:hypothetical protein
MIEEKIMELDIYLVGGLKEQCSLPNAKNNP